MHKVDNQKHVEQENEMATSFASLKKSRKSNLEKLQSEVDKINNPQTNFSREDNRFWKAELDKSGNGYAVIRFLPSLDENKLPFVRVFNHGFQGPGGWYIENSLTTIGQKDPLAEYNSCLLYTSPSPRDRQKWRIACSA